MNQSAAWLVAYDIRSPRRLRQVHRYLSKEALRIQYSVFLVEGTPQHIDALRNGLADLIDPRDDDVRIYRVPDSPWVHTLGVQGLPEGVFMLSATARDGQVLLTGPAQGATLNLAVDTGGR